jgi:acetyl esterase/lipase
MLESRKHEIFVAPSIGIIQAALDAQPPPHFDMTHMKRDATLVLERQQTLVPELKKRGIRLLPGGDYGFPFNPHGRNARDLALWVQHFGYTPAEVLSAATALGGEIMGPSRRARPRPTRLPRGLAARGWRPDAGCRAAAKQAKPGRDYERRPVLQGACVRVSEVPDDLAAALRALGPGFNLPQVQALYAPLLAAQPRDGVQCLADRPYGSHERQRLDVYVPESAPDDPRPVLVAFHGGGFIRGDKSQRANLGFWAAREGFLAVLPNYRLAPESRWPSGPQDVVAAWQWVQSEAARWGGDPKRVVLMGESAGAAHVAAATLCRAFQPPSWRIAAAVLLSGPYNAGLEGSARAQFGIATPDPRNEAYFGSDPAAWTKRASSTASTRQRVHSSSATPSATCCRCKSRPASCSRAS